MVAISSLSVAANQLRALLQQQIPGLDVGRIKIGHPKDTFPEMEDGGQNDKDNLNLFFYNVIYDGYPADGLSEDPLFIRLFCLITSVAGKSSKPSPGENDLRLVGEVMRVLHQYPVVSVSSAAGNEIARLQIVPHPMNLDNLNHVWSTQGETAYRLSVAYEMALAPVPLGEAIERSPRVGEIGVNVQPDVKPSPLPEDGFHIATAAPSVPLVTVDTTTSGWSPHICFVYQGNDENEESCRYSLASAKDDQDLSDFEPRVWVAAAADQDVDLVWETWRNDAGWRVVSRWRDIYSVALATHPGSASIYAARNRYGVSKSEDGGIGWQEKNNGLNNLNTQIVAIDPVTPANVYVGSYGGGLYKSEDSGDNWQQKNLGTENPNVQFIAVDPVRPSTVYAGVYGEGVYKSVDDGDSWAQKNSGLNSFDIVFIAINPITPTTVYAAGYADGIYRSDDGGDSWSAKNGGLKELDVRFLAIDPSTPETVLAATSGAGVFKSEDSGETWKPKRNGLKNLDVRSLAIDPQKPAIVYAATNGGGVYRSDDGGENWQGRGAGLDHSDIRWLSIDLGATVNLLAGTRDGSVFKSNDAGVSWERVGGIEISARDERSTIDPDEIESATTFLESLPDKSAAGQFMLYALRNYRSAVDGQGRESRSNPLLITVYEAGQ